MLDHLDSTTLAAFAAQRAAIAAAQERADAYAITAIAAAQARLNTLTEGRARLGSTPTPDAFVTPADWARAVDQHAFATSRFDRDIVSADQRLGEVRQEHAGLLAEVPVLQEQYRSAVIAAFDAAAARKVQEAADIATVRESLLLRFTMGAQPANADKPQRDRLKYYFRPSGFRDVSFFVANVTGDGFTPDKSAAIAAELQLI